MWFRGANPHISSSNNFLEGFNSTIKKIYFSKNYFSTHGVLDIITHMIRDKGYQYQIDNTLQSIAYPRDYVTVNEYSVNMIGKHCNYYTYLFQRTHETQRLEEMATETQSNSGNIFNDSLEKQEKGLSLSRIRTLLTSNADFANYKEYKSLLGNRIVAKKINARCIWEDYYCNCLSYFKTKKCKHIFILAKFVLGETVFFQISIINYIIGAYSLFIAINLAFKLSS